MRVNWNETVENVLENATEARSALEGLESTLTDLETAADEIKSWIDEAPADTVTSELLKKLQRIIDFDTSAFPDIQGMIATISALEDDLPKL